MNFKPSKNKTLVERFTAWIGSIYSLAAHTLLFVISFCLGAFEVASWDRVLLVLTTMVSLEAIYLAIFIQMTVNRNTESLQAVEEDVDEIQEDVAHVEGKIDEIETDVDRIQEDVEGIGEELEEINEDETEEVARKRFQAQTLSQITKDLEKLLADIETLKKKSSKV